MNYSLELFIGALVMGGIIIVLVALRSKMVMRQTTIRRMYNSEKVRFGAWVCPHCKEELWVIVFVDSEKHDLSKNPQLNLVCPDHHEVKLVAH